MIEYLTTTPQTKKALAEKAGCPVREIELAVQAARLEGQPILSDADGYRLSEDPAEVARCAERLRSRAIHQLETAQALAGTAQRMRFSTASLWPDL